MKKNYFKVILSRINKMRTLFIALGGFIVLAVNLVYTLVTFIHNPNGTLSWQSYLGLGNMKIIYLMGGLIFILGILSIFIKTDD